MRTRYTERLAEPSRAAAEEARVGEPAARGHSLQSSGRLQRTDQDGAGRSLLAADHVQAPVDAVRAVHVHVPALEEHRGVAVRQAVAEPVRGGILVVVGLYLDDHAADAIDGQLGSDQRRRDLVRASRQIERHI